MPPAGLLGPQARLHLAGRRGPHTPAGRHRRGLQAGVGPKDIGALIGLLDPDATATGDGGGLVTAVLRPIEGAEQIARFFVDRAVAASGLTILERTVNGQPGLVA